MKTRGYQSYIWVYILGTALTLANGLFWHSELLFHLSLTLLYCILFYKGVHILLCYSKTAKIQPTLSRVIFHKTYRTFRLRVALFWLAFIGLCILGKYVLHVATQYFYSCTFFFLFLDRIFVNKLCLLQKFCDPKGAIVPCCCGCPCRGWDLMMIHTPLLFALKLSWSLESLLVILSSILALFSLVQWEIQKYHLVELRKKCAKPCDLKLCMEHRMEKTCPDRH